MKPLDSGGTSGPLDNPIDPGDADDRGPSLLAEEDLMIELAAATPDLDLPNRLWIKAIVPLLQLRSEDAGPSGRVGFAFDQMYIAACERLCRIFRSDLDSAEG